MIKEESQDSICEGW